MYNRSFNRARGSMDRQLDEAYRQGYEDAMNEATNNVNMEDVQLVRNGLRQKSKNKPINLNFLASYGSKHDKIAVSDIDTILDKYDIDTKEVSTLQDVLNAIKFIPDDDDATFLLNRVADIVRYGNFKLMR